MTREKIEKEIKKTILVDEKLDGTLVKITGKVSHGFAIGTIGRIFDDGTDYPGVKGITEDESYFVRLSDMERIEPASELIDGHQYVCIEPERSDYWNSDGGMDYVLDRKPYTYSSESFLHNRMYRDDRYYPSWHWLPESFVDVTEPVKSAILNVEKTRNRVFLSTEGIQVVVFCGDGDEEPHILLDEADGYEWTYNGEPICGFIDLVPKK